MSKYARSTTGFIGAKKNLPIPKDIEEVRNELPKVNDVINGEIVIYVNREFMWYVLDNGFYKHTVKIPKYTYVDKRCNDERD